MTKIAVENKRVSINHAEIWGYTEDNECAYVRVRDDTLEIRVANEFDEKDSGFIKKESCKPERSVETQVKDFKKLAIESIDINELLDGTGYQLDQTVRL